MSDYIWEEIDTFQSIIEFKRFLRWIEIQSKNGQCEEIFENIIDSKNIWRDRRFKCLNTGKIWRLSYPDPGYFPGSWLPEKN